jgi:hypothetical protein
MIKKSKNYGRIATKEGKQLKKCNWLELSIFYTGFY